MKTETAKTSYQIAVEFAERFQKNYPAEPLHEMMEDLRKEIELFAHAESSPLSSLTADEFADKFMEVLHQQFEIDCKTEFDDEDQRKIEHALSWIESNDIKIASRFLVAHQSRLPSDEEMTWKINNITQKEFDEGKNETGASLSIRVAKQVVAYIHSIIEGKG